ncbi:NAD(P)/FAD-dependent oxidoreductase [Methylocystis sp. JR02]|uniref:FAD-dependent oxidoreductase n=1 Tax=Methylocystis sp. JR02 TaxID=3046284 RepID=UPI0024BA3F5E|nr:NAD(P)/FAD-dependent oxidoreductase [Methylocystis sp. JR02]MDJ0450847.1 FAD-dependent oxidoreductase [Methylocystis sp. JR02]
MLTREFDRPSSQEFDHFGDTRTFDAPGFADVIVVGGGLAGLTAAWRMEGFDVTLLEEGRNVGGAARFERHGELRFPTAASCLQSPAPDGRVAELLKDLGLWGSWRSTSDDLLVLFKTGGLIGNLGVVSHAFLSHPASLMNPKVYRLTGSLIGAALSGQAYVAAEKRLGDPIFAHLNAYLARLAPGKGRYPSIPWKPADGWSRAEMEQFDSVTLEQLLSDARLRETLPPDLRPPKNLDNLVRDAIVTTLQVESLTLDDVSGYVGLHFLIGYLYGELVAFPGGNGFVTERLRERLELRESFHCVNGAKVTSIRSHGADRYRVTFQRDGQEHFIEARAVVWAASKHAALEAIHDLPSAQRAAMAEIEYGDYIVANVVLKQPVWGDRFGAYIIAGKDEAAPMGWCRIGGCISANWLDPTQSHPGGVLTLLKPVSRRDNMGRLAKVAFRDLQETARAEVSDILACAGVSPQAVEDIRLWLWPKGLVSPRPGQMKSDLFRRASAPFGRMVFANQDTYGVGNFESAVGAGLDAAERLKMALGATSVPLGAEFSMV